MEYIIVENGIITAHRCGATKPENAITVLDGFAGYVGSPYAALKDDLTGLKPLSQQVTEGIVAVPEGYTINATDTGFIRMEQSEIVLSAAQLVSIKSSIDCETNEDRPGRRPAR